MTKIAGIILILLFSTASAYAGADIPVSKIQLITKRPNVPESKTAGTGETLGLWLGGGVFNGDRAYKEAEKLFTKYPSLKDFYPTAADRKRFCEDARQAFEESVGEVENIYHAIYGIEFLTHHLGAKIMDRALVSKGVTSKSRRQQWSDLLKNQLHACTSQSKSFFKGALPCSDIFSEALPTNIGLAAMTELTNAKLAGVVNDSKALYAVVDSEYRTCIKSKNFATEQVEPCARKGMRTAVSRTVMEQTRKAIEGEFKSPKRLQSTLSEINTRFGKCIDTALLIKKTDDAGTWACIDELVSDAGTRTIRERVNTEDAVIAYYPTPAARTAYSKIQEATFEKCVIEQRKKGARDKTGVLLIDPCRNLVTNAITYEIVLKNFHDAANDSLSAENPEDKKEVARTEAARAAAQRDTKAVLDRCWDKYQSSDAKEACLRKGVSKIAETIASQAMDLQMGEGVLKAKPELKAKLLAPFLGCVNRGISGNVSEDHSLKTKINQCVGPLRRTASLEAAEHEIRTRLGNEIPAEITEDAVKRLVTQQFGSCLGNSPDDATGRRCTASLRRDAAKDLGAILFPSEINKLLPIGSTEEEQKLFEAKAAQAGKDITAEFKGCIDKHVRLNTAETAEKRIDVCMKKSVQQIAIFIANLQIDSKIASLYGDNVKGLEELKKILIKELTECMNQKPDLEFDKYVKKITVCGDTTSERAILYIARDQLQRVLRKIEIAEKLQPGPPSPPVVNEIQNCRSNTDSITEFVTPVEKLKYSMDEIFDAYVGYDPATAKKDVLDLLAKINRELANPSESETRQRVLQWLSKDTHVVTQVLKAMVRDQVKQGFESLPPSERPAPSVIAKATSNEALDEIFDAPAGKDLVLKLIDGMLEPIIVGDEPISSPVMQETQKAFTAEIKNLLASSPQFAQTIADGYMQPELDKTSHLERGLIRMVQFFKGSFHTAFSKDAMDWENVKQSPKGKIAEKFIVEKIVRPSVTGEPLSTQEKAKRKKDAAKLVKAALLAKR